MLTVRAWFDWLTMSGLRYRGTTIESGLRHRGTTIQGRWGAFDLIDNAGGGGYNEPLASLPK